MSNVNADLGTATYRITGDASGASNAANQANASLAQLEKAVAGNWWGIQNLAGAFAALPAAVAAGTGAAIKAAADWESAMAGVEKTTYDASLSVDQNKKALGELEGQLKDIAKTKPVASVEIAGIAESAGALGVAKEDIGVFTSTVADLAATTDLTADAAATNLARLAALTNVAGDGYKNLASSILEAGRSTAATETQIVGVAARIAGAAKTYGITGDQIVGIAAAMATAGVKQELAGTNFQKTLIDIDRAIQGNGKELRVWAKLAGESTTEFSAHFRDDAAGAFAAVIEGLARTQKETGSLAGALDGVGITESRQIQLLSLLAAAQNSTANENVKLTNIMDLSTKAFKDGNVITDIAGRRYKTFQSQVQLLKNALFEMGVQVGSALLPFLKALVQLVQFLVRGFIGLPGPVRAIMGALIGLASILLGVIALFLLFVPRLVLAGAAAKQLFPDLLNIVNGLRGVGAAAASTVSPMAASTAALEVQEAELRAMALILDEVALSYGEASTAAGFFARTNATMAGANLRVGAANAGAAASAGKNAQSMVNAGAAAGSMAGGVAEAGSEVSRFSSVLGKAGKILGVVGIALTAFTLISSIWNHKIKDGSEASKGQAEAVDKLVEAFQDGTKAGREAINTWTRQQVKEKELAKTAKALGISRKELYAIIQGTASSSEYESFVKKITDADKAGVDGARDFGNGTRELARSFAASKDEALLTGASYEYVASAGLEAAGSAQAAADALQQDATTADRVASAYIDMVDAQFAVQQAAFDVKDAEEAVAQARRDQEKKIRDVRKAELDLARARLTASSSADDIRQAEQDLAKARLDQATSVSKAEDGLADAIDTRAAAVESLAEKEQALQDLKSKDYTEALTKAENDLADAKRNVRDANQKVADSEWYLNYLRGEGAGARDIKDAENAISDAKLDAAQAQTKLTDAEKEAEKLKDPLQRAKAIAAAERDVQSARRDVEQATIAIREKELELSQVRQDAANNTVVRDAENNLASARLDAEQNAFAVTDAEEALATARREATSDDVLRAQFEYEQSLVRQAQAMAEIVKQKRLISGEESDSGKEAADLVAQLKNIADALPDNSPTKKNLQKLIDMLSKAPKIPAVEDSISEPIADPGSSFSGTDPLDDLEKNVKDPSRIERIKQGFLDNLGGVGFLAGTIAAMIALAVGAVTVGMPALFVALAGAVGFGLGLLAKYLIKNGPRIAKSFMSWAKEVPGQLGRFAASVGSFLAGLPAKLAYAAGFLLGFLARAVGTAIGGSLQLMQSLQEGITSGLSTVWGYVGRFITQTLPRALGSAFDAAWEFVTNPSQWLSKGIALALAIGSIASSMWSAGWEIVQGLWHGIEDAWNGFQDFVGGLITSFIQGFLDGLGIHSPSTVFMEIGDNIIRGLWEGIKAAWESGKKFFTDLPTKIKDLLVNTTGWLVNKGTNIIGGLLDGIHDKWESVKSFFGSLETILGEIIKNPKDWLFDIGKNVLQGFIDGMKELWDKIPGPLKDGAEAAVKGITDFFDINSPSRKMMWIGQMVGEGLEAGIKTGMLGAVQQMDKSSKDLAAAQFMSDRLDAFGLDAYDVGAFIRPDDFIPATLPESSGGVSRSEHTEITYEGDTLQLTAKTDATPGEIFGEFRYQSDIKPKGAGSRPR